MRFQESQKKVTELAAAASPMRSHAHDRGIGATLSDLQAVIVDGGRVWEDEHVLNGTFTYSYIKYWSFT